MICNQGPSVAQYMCTCQCLEDPLYYLSKLSGYFKIWPQEKRHSSFEYGRYGNYTTVVAEEKIRSSVSLFRPFSQNFCVYKGSDL